MLSREKKLKNGWGQWKLIWIYTIIIWTHLPIVGSDTNSATIFSFSECALFMFRWYFKKWVVRQEEWFTRLFPRVRRTNPYTHSLVPEGMEIRAKTLRLIRRYVLTTTNFHSYPATPRIHEAQSVIVIYINRGSRNFTHMVKSIDWPAILMYDLALTCVSDRPCGIRYVCKKNNTRMQLRLIDSSG